MRTRRRLPALAIGVLAPALAVLLVPTVPSVAGPVPAATRLSISPSFTGPGVFHDAIANDVHDRIRYTGTLEADEAGTWTPAPGETVQLERMAYDAATWSVVATGTTDDAGAVSLAHDVGRTARYRLSFAGSAEEAASTSPVEQLDAMRDFNARMTQDGRKLSLHGPRISPAWKAKPVSWYRKQGAHGDWKLLERKHSGADGSWRFRAQFPLKVGTWHYRAGIPRTEGFVRSFSVQLHARTTPAGRVALIR